MQVEILRKHREFTAGEKVQVPDARGEAMIEMEIARKIPGRPKKRKKK